jgi:hypothetical protein
MTSGGSSSEQEGSWRAHSRLSLPTRSHTPFTARPPFIWRWAGPQTASAAGTGTRTLIGSRCSRSRTFPGSLSRLAERVADRPSELVPDGLPWTACVLRFDGDDPERTDQHVVDVALLERNVVDQRPSGAPKAS